LGEERESWQSPLR